MVVTTDSPLSTLVGRQFTDAVQAATAHLDRFRAFGKRDCLSKMIAELGEAKRHLEEAFGKVPRLRRLRDSGTCPDCRGTGSPTHPLPGFCVTCEGTGVLHCLKGQTWRPPGLEPKGD